MNFNDINKIKEYGFVGFKTMRELFIDNSCLPSCKGVYLVMHVTKSAPEYLLVGSGGHFKGHNPNVSIEELKRNWIANALVVYIGKAGSDSSQATLKSRLKQYLGFGLGKNIGHWGGRLIWQLASYEDLVVCWKPLLNEDPRNVEAQMIREFEKQYRSPPFANLSN